MNADLPQPGDDLPPPTPLAAEALSTALKDDAPAAFPVAQPAPWNFDHLVAAWFISFLTQNFFLPCMCAAGDAKMIYAYCFDGLMAVRILIAWRCREKGKGWLFYLLLLYLSPFWIDFMAETFFRYYH